MQGAQNGKRTFLVDDLQRRRHRFVARRHRLVRTARGAEQRLELGREYRAHRRLAIVPRHRHP
jgi:hypothetical protein